MGLFIDTHACRQGHGQNLFGLPIYSYALASQAHLGAIEIAGIDYKIIDSPVELVSPRWRGVLDDGQDRTVLLSFKNFRNLRPVGWAYNVACVVWEFDVLSGPESARGRPFRNQIQMLRGFDEIWCASAHFKGVLENYGFKKVRIIPAPVDFSDIEGEGKATRRAVLSRLSVPASPQSGARDVKALGLQPAWRNPNKQVFLSIFNPLDPRKDLSSLLAAFSLHAARNPDAVLVIKVSVDADRFPLASLWKDIISARGHASGALGYGENILIMNESLPREEIWELYQLADFYVSPTRAEGQNLPLLEAMACGLPAISPKHTAMLDYFSDEVGVEVPSTSRQVPNGVRANYHIDVGAEWHEISMLGLGQALGKAAKLSKRAYAEKSARAVSIVTERYSNLVVAREIARALAAASKRGEV